MYFFNILKMQIEKIQIGFIEVNFNNIMFAIFLQKVRFFHKTNNKMASNNILSRLLYCFPRVSAKLPLLGRNLRKWHKYESCCLPKLCISLFYSNETKKHVILERNSKEHTNPTICLSKGIDKMILPLKKKRYI